MTRKKLLRKQTVLDAINHWILEHGLPPTIQELRKVLKVGSDRTVLRYLSWLEEEGDIERWPGSRGLRPLKHGTNDVVTRPIPLVGQAPAGPLMIAEENRRGFVQLPIDWLRSNARYYLLRVNGDSMNKALVHGELIENGDLAVVEQRSSAEPNEIVVALIDGQATIKRLVRGPNYWVLKPESVNPGHSSIMLDSDFSIQGVVVRVLKRGAFLLDENLEP